MSRFIDYGRIAAVAQEVRALLADDFDEVTFLDTLDGETDVMDTTGRMIAWIIEAKANEAAMKEAADIYAARAKRFAGHQEAARRVLATILDATGEAKIAHPNGTVSRTAPRVSLRITDETAIPPQFTITHVVADAKAIKAAIEAGAEVPGAEMVTGEPGLMVRVK